MAESSKLQCESCQYKNVSTSASIWCTVCKEGLCNECHMSHKALKMSRNHNVITAEEYHVTKKLNIDLECPDHSKQLDSYCPTHDSVLCAVCVCLNHSGCKDVMQLDEAANGAKKSSAFINLDQTIDEILQNIVNGVRHLQTNKRDLKEQEDVTKKYIATKRTEINRHLDRLEEKLLKELKDKSEKVITEINLITTKFETKRKIISDLKDIAQYIEKFSSNLQVFVGIRCIMKTVGNELNEIKVMVTSIPQLSVAVHVNPKFDTFTEDFDDLGEINLISKEAVVPFFERQVIQAPYQSSSEAAPPDHKFDNLQLSKRTIIKMVKRNNSFVRVTSCLILPNNCIMIAISETPSLTILTEDGSHDRDISVPYKPDDLTLLEDQWVAVVHKHEKCISVVNLNNVDKNMTLKDLCSFGINCSTYNDGKFYIVTMVEGIKVKDLDKDIITTLPIDNKESPIYKITVQKDKIYYSVSNGSVYCVVMDGREIWKCHDDLLEIKHFTASRLYCFFSSPSIAVDNYSTTFALGHDNNVLLAISPDGRQQKVLLSSSDGLHFPFAMYYDNNTKRLLICNNGNGQRYVI